MVAAMGSFETIREQLVCTHRDCVWHRMPKSLNNNAKMFVQVYATIVPAALCFTAART